MVEVHETMLTLGVLFALIGFITAGRIGVIIGVLTAALTVASNKAPPETAVTEISGLTLSRFPDSTAQLLRRDDPKYSQLGHVETSKVKERCRGQQAHRKRTRDTLTCLHECAPPTIPRKNNAQISHEHVLEII